MLPCKREGCIYQINSNPDKGTDEYCCQCCSNFGAHEPNCKKLIAKCTNCNYVRNASPLNNDGLHCCQICNSSSGKTHDLNCEKNEYKTQFPKQIFICDKTTDFIGKYSFNWKRLNPEYDIILYDNERCRQFLLSEFSQKHVDIFNYLDSGPIKADFWRVCAIYRYGGLYVDADAEPIVPLDHYIDPTVEFVTCSSYGEGPTFNPNFIFAKAGDSFLKLCIDTYVQMYDDRVPFTYWGWSIMTLFRQLLKLENYNKEPGIYYDYSGKKYQILKEVPGTSFYDDHNVYNGLRLFNNRYSSYNCFTHSFNN
jgi:hypothetical protein